MSYLSENFIHSLKAGSEGNPEEHFQRFVKHIPAAIAMFDKEMRYLAVSDRWIEDYQIQDEDILGKLHYDVFPHLSEEWKQIYQLCLNGVVKEGEEDPITRTDGSIEWVSWEVRPWKDADEEIGGLIIYTELITERKKAELALLKAKEMAEDASLAKSNFISRMSHEFRTPLTGILGYAEMLEEDSNLSQQQRKYIQQILSGGNHLLDMLDDILDLSRIETGRIEFVESTINISQLIEEIISVQNQKHAKNQNKLSVHIDRNVPSEMVTDEKKLIQILGHLIDNALKFTKRGEVDIRAGYDPVEDSNAARGGMLTVQVSDTGSGIPEDQLKNIFKPFTQAEERYNEGTGLGLTIVYRLTRFLGGHSKVESEVGEGSTFSIKIPVQVEEEVLDEQNMDAEARMDPQKVADYIRSLPEEDRKMIRSALEVQDMDELACVKLSVRQDEGALQHLRESAQNFDFLFITKVYKHLANND